MTEQSEPKTGSIRCHNCGHDNLATASVCLVCDSPLTYTSRFKKAQQMPTGLLPPTEEELQPAQQEEQPAKVTDEVPVAPPPKTGVKCPACGYMNRVGDLFCFDCGANIAKASQEGTFADITQQISSLNMDEIQAEIEKQKAFVTFASDPPPAEVAKPTLKSVDDDVVPEGCFQFYSDMHLRLTETESGHYTEVTPDKDKPLLVGRSHKSLPTQPEVDLTPFLMEKHGVSRRHALIRLRDSRLEIQDLDSTNGTGINGFRFGPKETHQIRNGDIITLGRVNIKISFIRPDVLHGDNVTEKLNG